MTDLTPDLQYLVGEPLNQVCFVMDYVELHFNGSYIRCLEPPTVVQSAKQITFPASGSRDALCSLIERQVRSVQGVDGGELRLQFDDGSLVTVDLSHERRASPEAIHFRNEATGETQYW